MIELYSFAKIQSRGQSVEIGRQARLKIVWRQLHAGSIPASGTNLSH